MDSFTCQPVLLQSDGAPLFASVSKSWNAAWTTVRPSWLAARGQRWDNGLIRDCSDKPLHGWDIKIFCETIDARFLLNRMVLARVQVFPSKSEITYKFERDQCRYLMHIRKSRREAMWSNQHVKWNTHSQPTQFDFGYRGRWFRKRGNNILYRDRPPPSHNKAARENRLLECIPPFESIPNWLRRPPNLIALGLLLKNVNVPEILLEKVQWLDSA